MAPHHPIAALHSAVGRFLTWRRPNNYSMLLTVEEYLPSQVKALLIDIRAGARLQQTHLEPDSTTTLACFIPLGARSLMTSRMIRDPMKTYSAEKKKKKSTNTISWKHPDKANLDNKWLKFLLRFLLASLSLSLACRCLWGGAGAVLVPLHTSLEQYGMKLQRRAFTVDYSVRLSGEQKHIFGHLARLNLRLKHSAAVHKNPCKFVNIPVVRIQPAKYLHNVCVVPVWVFLCA